MNEQIRVGDYVCIADRPGSLTWQVDAISGPHETANGPLYTLISGQTGRRRYETRDRITLYKRGDQQ